MKKLLLILCISTILYGCSRSIDEISSFVKNNMQEKFNSDSNFKKYNLQVKKVTVMKIEGNKYKGIADVNFKENSYDVPIEIISDNKQMMWEAQAGAFAFIAQKEFQELQKDFDNQMDEYNKKYVD